MKKERRILYEKMKNLRREREGMSMIYCCMFKCALQKIQSYAIPTIEGTECESPFTLSQRIKSILQPVYQNNFKTSACVVFSVLCSTKVNTQISFLSANCRKSHSKTVYIVQIIMPLPNMENVSYQTLWKLLSDTKIIFLRILLQMKGTLPFA